MKKCVKCEQEKEVFSNFNKSVCFECFHTTDAKDKYTKWASEKAQLKQSNQFPSMCYAR